MTVPDHSAPYRVEDKYVGKPRPVRVVCIGAGASGIYTAIRQEQLLQNVSFQIYEKNDDVGGTWLENKYPGCSCDVPAHIYTYSFEPKTDWSMYYAGSDEIQEYFKGVVMKYGVLKYIKFNHLVVAARWNDHTGLWNLEIETDEGNIIKDDCNILLNATGILNAWKWPNIPGLHDFKGKLLHTAKYDRSWDLKGKNVALLGNGSSAIQVVPTSKETSHSFNFTFF
jgi:cation diffusion facilitator CzcD-associated flavoprotein CzcO